MHANTSFNWILRRRNESSLFLFCRSLAKGAAATISSFLSLHSRYSMNFHPNKNSIWMLQTCWFGELERSTEREACKFSNLWTYHFHLVAYCNETITRMKKPKTKGFRATCATCKPYGPRLLLSTFHALIKCRFKWGGFHLEINTRRKHSKFQFCIYLPKNGLHKSISSESFARRW